MNLWASNFWILYKNQVGKPKLSSLPWYKLNCFSLITKSLRHCSKQKGFPVRYPRLPQRNNAHLSCRENEEAEEYHTLEGCSSRLRLQDWRSRERNSPSSGCWPETPATYRLGLSARLTCVLCQYKPLSAISIPRFSKVSGLVHGLEHSVLTCSGIRTTTTKKTVSGLIKGDLNNFAFISYFYIQYLSILRSLQIYIAIYAGFGFFIRVFSPCVRGSKITKNRLGIRCHKGVKQMWSRSFLASSLLFHLSFAPFLSLHLFSSSFFVFKMSFTGFILCDEFPSTDYSNTKIVLYKKIKIKRFLTSTTRHTTQKTLLLSATRYLFGFTYMPW